MGRRGAAFRFGADAALAAFSEGGAAHVGARGQAVFEEEVFEGVDVVEAVDLFAVEEDGALGEVEGGGGGIDGVAGEEEGFDLGASF